MAGIYLHIPFCKQACHYCDFHFSTSRAGQRDLVEALVEEIRLQKNYLQDETITTVYFGGGTPSLLSPAELNLLFSAIKKDHIVCDNPEVTLEANPDDLDKAQLDDLRKAGFNRLSIGIQSFRDSILKYLNRAHNADSALQSFNESRQAGFSNISIDLIYAIPGQSEDEWLENIRQAITLNPEHISAYSLTIEERTVFGHKAARGNLIPVSDDSAARQLEILMNELEKAGYEHYEISNFCRPGFESKHNSSYWRQEKYLGVGPSAHSYNGTSRQSNINNNAVYVRAIKNGTIPFELETLRREDHINEYLLTTLRTTWGCDLEWLRQNLGYDILALQHDYLQDLFSKNLAALVGTHLKLTKKGKLFADKIASDLFLIND